MRIEDMMLLVQREMPQKRWEHTLGVVETSAALAERYGADPMKAKTAAVLHDVAKYWPVEKQRQTVEADGDPDGVLQYDKELWHAHAGAYTANHEFGIGDSDILDAIRYHTSGRVGMSLLEKIVCLADYIEPGRDFPGVGELRSLSETSLDKALVAGFDGTISFLIEKRKRIYPLTVLTRNDLLQSIAREVIQ